MREARYAVRPKADCDLDEQAFRYSTAGSPELGHRFLVAAHETFSLLGGQPNMGWHRDLQRPDLKSLRVFRVKGFERILILYLPLLNGVEILRVIHGSRDIQALLHRKWF